MQQEVLFFSVAQKNQEKNLEFSSHFHYECLKKNRYSNDGSETKAHFVETREEMQEMLLMTCIDVNKEADEITWFLDSGCSNHMCGKRELFSQFDDTFQKSINLGNNSILCVMGKG